MVAAGITPASSGTGDPLLLTPGPLTTSRSVKQVMLHDWGSLDAAFMRINREVTERLPGIVGAAATHVTVPMQGSGTFVVEGRLDRLHMQGALAAARDVIEGFGMTPAALAA